MRASAACLPVALVLGACGETPRPPSVLLVTLDTTRADRIGCYDGPGSFGDTGAGTPHLDALAARGVRFERAYTTAPITLPAHASLLTGTYPPYHGVRDNGTYRLPAAATTLTELLADRGYRTAACVAAYPLFPEYGLDQGFELYDFPLLEEPEPDLAGGERRAASVVDAALPWLRRFAPDEPTFLWLHFYDPHWSYKPPAPFAARYPEDPYQGEISYADAQLGRVLAELEELGVLDNTLVVVAADHGEEFGEHGEKTHALLVYDTTLHVPLIFAGPGVPEGTSVSGPVSLVDVLPTLAELLDLPLPEEVQGRSLVALLEGEPDAVPPPVIYAESWYGRLHHGWSELRAVVQRDGDADWKLIDAPRAEGGARELFSLTRDRAELQDLVALEPERAAELARELDRLAGSTAGGLDARVALDTEGAAMLRDLGYAGTEQLDVPAVGLLGDPRLLVGTAQDLADATDLLIDGELDAALPLIEALEAREPGSLTALELRGLHELLRGQANDDSAALERAARAFREATRLQPRHEANWLRLSIALRDLRRYPEAIRALRASMTLAPVTKDMLAVEHVYLDEFKQLAHAREARGDFASALDCWEDLVQLEPGNAAMVQERDRVRMLTER